MQYYHLSYVCTKTPKEIKWFKAFKVRYIIVFLPIFWYTVSFGQYGTTEGLILLTGEVIMEDSITPLADVHMLNRNNRQVTVTDPSGFFSMYVTNTHVIRFSSVGFDNYFFSIPGGFKGDVFYIRIVLMQRITPLENVTIYGEDEVTESMLRRETPPNPLEGVQFGTQQGERREIEPTIANPMSLLWDWFSREGKERRKLKEVLKQDAIRSRVDNRFDSELIWELTGLYGDELERFKVFCNLPASYVLNANEYDFLIAVKGCYYRYKNQ